MNTFNQLLLILHFLGLAMGLSVSIANMVMSGVVSTATPAEQAVLGRFPPIMSKVGGVGLVLLWVTGVILVYTRWAGFATLPWQFHVKLTAVVLLTVAVGYAHRLERMIRMGDTAAARRMETTGRIATALAVISVIFAVLTFD